MKDDDAIANAAREARRRARVPDGSVCFICGLSNPDCLVEVDRTLLEEHHVAGIANVPDLTVYLCPNCHRLLHMPLRDKGLDFSRPVARLLLEVIVYVLLGTSVLSARAARTYAAFADALRVLIASLDAHCADWRTLPEALY